MRFRRSRRVIWGDRKHWELRIGWLNIYRWCKGKPCHLPGIRLRWHPVKVQVIPAWRSSLERYR